MIFRKKYYNTEKSRYLQVGDIYRHFKNNSFYIVFNVFKDFISKKYIVCYREYINNDKPIEECEFYCRDIDNFLSLTKRDNHEITQRFQLFTKEEINKLSIDIRTNKKLLAISNNNIEIREGSYYKLKSNVDEKLNNMFFDTDAIYHVEFISNLYEDNIVMNKILITFVDNKYMDTNTLDRKLFYHRLNAEEFSKLFEEVKYYVN